MLSKIDAHNTGMASIIDSKWRLFLQVADMGSVSRGAASIDLPQSVVSRQIGQLEADCGGRLFRRTGRGVVLTELGEQVYPRILKLAREADVLADEIHTSSGIPMGDVRLGLLPSAVPIAAGPFFSETKRQWPQIRLSFMEGPGAQLEEWLQQGRLDMALLLREEGQERPDETVLKRTPLYLVVPSKHPLAARKTITFREVCGWPLVLPPEAHPLRARLAALAREKNVSLIQALEADSIRLQHEIVASDGGFAITAGTLSGSDAPRLARVRITHPTLTRSIVLGTTAHRPGTLATRSVAGLIRTLAPQLFR